MKLDAELRDRIPEGYDVYGWEELQNEWFRFHKSAFAFRQAEQHAYPFISYGEPYEFLMQPSLDGMRENGMVLLVFDQPHLFSLRQVFRQQTLEFRRNHNITYMFVMANEPNNPEAMHRLDREDKLYHDILLFNHTNSYHNLALSVLLAYHYLQSFQLPIKYVVKMDSDCAVNLPLLVSLLYSPEILSRTYTYAGDCLQSRFNTRDRTQKNFVPASLVQKDEWIDSYARGGLYVMTYNLLPPLLISTRHLPFLTHHEDANTGRAFNALSIRCSSLGEEHWLARKGCYSRESCKQYIAIHPQRFSSETRRYYKMIS